MEKRKRGRVTPLYLDSGFEELEGRERWTDVCYIIHDDGDVELCPPHDTHYPIITSEEILKLAEILKEKKEK